MSSSWTAQMVNAAPDDVEKRASAVSHIAADRDRRSIFTEMISSPMSLSSGGATYGWSHTPDPSRSRPSVSLRPLALTPGPTRAALTPRQLEQMVSKPRKGDASDRSISTLPPPYRS